MKRRRKEERPEAIARMLREFPDRKFSVRHLASATGGNTREGRRETIEVLRQLVAEGVAAPCGRDKYRLGNRMRPHYEGVVDMAASGLAMHVKVEGLEEDIFVRQCDSMNALDGDRVRVAVIRQGRGETEGEIIEILERAEHRYVGTAEVGRHAIFVRVDTRGLATDIYMPAKKYPQVEEGDKVVVRIPDWPVGQRTPQGELVDILGKTGENDAEMHAILAEFDLPWRFEPEVERAADAIPAAITAADYAARRDFRDVPTFTIDPEDAKDFDDALSVRPLREGVWEIGVHIADVTHYVTPDTEVDREAQARGTSVYLVDRTIPMLPERLSNELCSLRPDEEKLCFSALFTLRDDLTLEAEWFGRTVIRSDRRFTYAEAQAVIETGTGDLSEELLTLHRLAQGLRAERFRKGAVVFEREEMKFRLDGDGRPVGVYFKPQQEANQLIEEFMLLANRRVAEFCSHRLQNGRRVPRTMVFRVHEGPTEEKLDRFRTLVARFGHTFRATRGRAVAREMNGLLARVRGTAAESAVSLLAVKSMSKACYSTDNEGHYGLAFASYTHFTSPIRRYPDMMVHRLLARYLEGGKAPDRKVVESLCEHASERETVASEAERASIRYKAVEFMAERTEQLFEGQITSLAEWGFYVELNDTKIEGVVHLRDIEGDYFCYDEKRYELYSPSTGRLFALGDPVTVRVRRADLKRRSLQFDLVRLPFARKLNR